MMPVEPITSYGIARGHRVHRWDGKNHRRLFPDPFRITIHVTGGYSNAKYVPVKLNIYRRKFQLYYETTQRRDET